MQTTAEEGAAKEAAASRARLLRIVIPAYPAFNIYSRVARETTALGPILVATSASKMAGWDVEVVDENNYREFGPKDCAGRPDHGVLQSIRPADVVGFYGGLSSTIPRLYELAAFYKGQNVPTIAGGQHFLEQNIEEGLNHSIDLVVIGEGEAAITEALDAIAHNRSPESIAGVAFMQNGRLVQTAERPPRTDFDLFPLPDFSLLRYAKMGFYPVNWVRGCGMDCEFCSVKGKARWPAPEYVLKQIASLLEQHGAKRFFVVDDLFGQNRSATLHLCHILEEYQKAVGAKLRIMVQIRLDKARDKELLQAMRRAGVTTTAIGFESPIAEELEAMNKKTKPEEMIALSRLYRKAGFRVHGMFIFGYPLNGKRNLSLPVVERARRFRKFIRKARIDTVQVLLPVPLPGTELTRRLAAEDRIFPIECVGWEYYDGSFPVFQPDEPFTPEGMLEAKHQIMGRFYRFRHSILIAVHILLFPAVAFSLHNLKAGWRKWHRSWRNSVLRFGGWVILQKWKSAFRRSDFLERLAQARQPLQRQ